MLERFGVLNLPDYSVLVLHHKEMFSLGVQGPYGPDCNMGNHTSRGDTFRGLSVAILLLSTFRLLIITESKLFTVSKVETGEVCTVRKLSMYLVDIVLKPS